MNIAITACVPYSGNTATRRTVDQLKQSGLVGKIILLTGY